MNCSSCVYLEVDKACQGALCGCKYHCKKLKKFVKGSDAGCKDYSKDYCRTNSECDRIFLDGEDFSDDYHSFEFYLIMAVFMIIGLLIIFIFNADLYGF